MAAAGLSAIGTSGVQFADVEVDIETGVTAGEEDRLRPGLRADRRSSYRRDASAIGGIIRGLNYALFENRILDRNTANMVNPNMEWYLLRRAVGHPEIDVALVDQPERGVIGIGEPPAMSTAAAVANAVANATGVRVRSASDHAGQAARRAASAREARI